MKKKLKAFTLVEVLVAMALLAAACLILVQVYLSVTQLSSQSVKINSSLSNQMKDVERYTNSQTISIPYGVTDTGGKINAAKNHIIIVNQTTNEKYYYGCDVLVLQPRDYDDVAITDTDIGYNDTTALRYKYLNKPTP